MSCICDAADAMLIIGSSSVKYSVTIERKRRILTTVEQELSNKNSQKAILDVVGSVY